MILDLENAAGFDGLGDGCAYLAIDALMWAGACSKTLRFEQGFVVRFQARCLGARKSVTSDQILDVNKDRIVLHLTEAEAQKLPAAEK